MPIDRAAYDDEARMVVVSMNGVTRAYPIAILNWHEAINDVIDGTPVAVIYCPLCDSISVVDRRIGDDVLEFGISGLLFNSNVLLYDRRDNALWSQVGLSAISGPNAGKSLTYLPWTITTFAALAADHPQATVVTRDTGHDRDYDRNPYVRYFASDRLMFPVTVEDPRLPAKARVIGVQLGEMTRAYPVDVIAASETGSITDELEGGHTLTLKADKSGVVEVAHLPPGAKLVHSFWFAWAALHNDTTIYGEPSAK
ncbi:MAG: hypothetical protein Kow00105_05490 [Phycisphaeraceae bacterium]